MDYRKVGLSGLRVSSISLGGWLTFGDGVNEETMSAILGRAVDGGVNFIDLADGYAAGKAERAFGRILAGLRRTELVISSKLFFPMSENPNDRGLSRKHIMESVERSLANLGTDYLDIYFCHREDPTTPLEETIRAMDDLVHQGKILYWGTSQWSPRLLRKTRQICNHRGLYTPIVEQPPYNLLTRWIEHQLTSVTNKLGMGLVVWSPLAGGILTGKYNEKIPAGSRGSNTDWLKEHLNEKTLKKVRQFCEIAAALSVQPAQLALAWILRRPEISSVIIGATSPEQIEINLAATEIDVPDHVARELNRIFPL